VLGTNGDLNVVAHRNTRVRCHPLVWLFQRLRRRNLTWGSCCQACIISLRMVMGSAVRARLSPCGTSRRITSHPVGPCAVRTTIPHARGCRARRDGTYLRGTACFSHGSSRSPSTPDPAAQPEADPRIGSRFGRCVRPPSLVSTRRRSAPSPG
jgi:hypothetical protein